MKNKEYFKSKTFLIVYSLLFVFFLFFSIFDIFFYFTYIFVKKIGNFCGFLFYGLEILSKNFGKFWNSFF